MTENILQKINIERLKHDFEQLARFTEPGRPYTRRAFTSLYNKSRRWLASRMEEVGLSTRFDSAGNLIGRRPGVEDNRPVIMAGSHLDTVHEGGRFDGIIGVLAVLEVCRALKDSGKDLIHPLEVVDFLSEEVSDFGVSTVGSRAMAGVLTKEQLDCTNEQGETLAGGIREAGGNPGQLGQARRTSQDIHCYLELHIEQGRVLEAHQVPIGIVSGIAGIHRYQLTIQGRPDHAGTTPMEMRKDALAPAALFITEVEMVGRELAGGSSYFVGTVGQLAIRPNSSNVIPGQVKLMFEFRSDNISLLDQALLRIEALAAEVNKQRAVNVTITAVGKSSPLEAHSEVQKIQVAACRKLGVDYLVTSSGAGHDAMFVGRIAPMGMFFIPSREGRSHCPEEWTDFQHVARGTEVLTQTILEVDKKDF